jgi:HD-GYP domain-containing protein (c-di-GMP phosphodiesterase class II)
LRIIKAEALKEGIKLGTAVKTYDGRVILAADTVLTDTYISKMGGFGIRHLYVEDESYSDVSFKPSITDDTRIIVTETMERVFRALSKKNKFSSAAVMRATKEIVSDVYSSLIVHDEPVSLFNLFALKDARITHAVNVATVAAALALIKECPPSIVEDSVQAALLHDIFLEDMDDDTHNVAHPSDTSDFIKETRTFGVRVYKGVAEHHERWDGSGFPREMQGDLINETARIIAVADMFDNLSSGYGCKPRDVNYALEELNAESGKGLDPEFVELFNKTVAIYPTGVTVKLNNGLSAVVVGQNRQVPQRPIVRLVSESAEERIALNMMLQVNQTVFIESVDL